MKILATYNIKGGVGKTATTVNLAHLAARDGFRTIVWDLDPQGAASFYFRVRPRLKVGTRKIIRGKHPLDEVVKGTDFEGLDLIPADFSYRNMDLALSDTDKPKMQLVSLLRPLASEYDLLLLDCAPSISLVSENVFFASDALLVPLIPTTLSLRTYEQIRHYFQKKNRPAPELLVFFSMVDRRKRLHRETVETLRAHDKRVLQTDIPYASQVEQMGVHRAPVTAFSPRSTPGAAYESLWEEVKARVMGSPA